MNTKPNLIDYFKKHGHDEGGVEFMKAIREWMKKQKQSAYTETDGK